MFIYVYIVQRDNESGFTSTSSSNYKMKIEFSNHPHGPEQTDYPNELKFGMHVPMGSIRGLFEAILDL